MAKTKIVLLLAVVLGAGFAAPGLAQEDGAEPMPVTVATLPTVSTVEPEPARGEVTEFNSGAVRVRFNTVPHNYEGRVAFTTEFGRIIGTVHSKDGDTLLVRVGYGENVPVGTPAQLTNERPTRASIPAQRRSNVRLTMTVRPFIDLLERTRFGGIIADVDLEWRLHSPVFLRLVMDPVGAWTRERETLGFGGAHVIGGYDSSAFAIGLGIGAQLIHPEDSSGRSDIGVGASLGLLIRFGSPDGFLLELFNAWTYYNRVHFGSLRVRAQWIVGHRSWMVIRGSGGLTRVTHIEAGFRRLLRGWSGEDALFLTLSLGGAFAFTNLTYFDMGPTLGLGIEKIW